MTSQHLNCDCHVFISLFLQTLAGTQLKDLMKQEMFKQALPRLAAFVLQGLQRPIRLRDGCDEFVKNAVMDVTPATSEHGWGFHSRAVTDEALSQNMSSTADAPAAKDAAWDRG